MRYDTTDGSFNGPTLTGNLASMPTYSSTPPTVEQTPLARIQSFLSGFSVEVTPGQADKVEDFAAALAPGSHVSVTALPGADISDTVRTAARLRRQGMVPVPHLAARSMTGAAHLRDFLTRLSAEAGVDEVLLIAGGVGQPLGCYGSSMDVLSSGILDEFGIKRIGVAGHPEGSPDIPDPAIAEALGWKNAFAERSDAAFYIVTQFCFDGHAVIAWDRAMRLAGNRLPIHIGIPGPATIKTLLAYARACGIGPSMRVLTRQSANIARLLTVSAPDEIISLLADYRANDPECGIQVAHFYPLGGFKRTLDWVNAVQHGNVTFGKRNRFTVKTD